MNKIKLFSVACAFSIGLTACGSNPEKPTEPENSASLSGQLPMWVLNPVVENGISASECVVWSGDMSLDKAEGTAMARASLAKQINIRVKAMDKTYKRKVKTASGVSSGGTFETVSKQVSNQFLQGSRTIKMDRVMLDGTANLCVQVAIDAGVTKELFAAIMSKSGANLDPQSEDVLYEEFKAYKGQEELEEATSN